MNKSGQEALIVSLTLPQSNHCRVSNSIRASLLFIEYQRTQNNHTTQPATLLGHYTSVPLCATEAGSYNSQMNPKWMSTPSTPWVYTAGLCSERSAICSDTTLVTPQWNKCGRAVREQQTHKMARFIHLADEVHSVRSWGLSAVASWWLYCPLGGQKHP